MFSNVFCLQTDWEVPYYYSCLFIQSAGGAIEVVVISDSHLKKLKDVGFTHIFSEPAMIDSDEDFANFVKSKDPALNILSYFFIVESLYRVKFNCQKWIHIKGLYWTFSKL